MSLYLLVFFLQALSMPQEQKKPLAPAKEAHNPAQSDAQGTAQHPFFVQQIVPKKSKDETENEEKEKSDKTWNDQITICIAGLTSIIFLVQTIVFGRQAVRLRQTIDTMKTIGFEQREDMNRSINASLAAVEIAQKTLASDRGWLCTNEASAGFHAQNTINGKVVIGGVICNISIANLGRSPANIYRMERYQGVIAVSETSWPWRSCRRKSSEGTRADPSAQISR